MHLCGAIVNVVSVGGEDGEGLEHVRSGGLRERVHPVRVEICHAKVRFLVEDLHPLSGCRMQGRNDDVGGKNTETPFGMDLSVNGGGDHGRIPERELTELSVPVEDCAAALAAEVEHGQVAAPLGVDMAVHALVFSMAPVRKDARVEILQIPLLDFQVIPDFETGLDAPVGQIRIDAVGRYVDVPGAGNDLSIVSPDCMYLDIAACSCGEQGCPVFLLPHHFAAFEYPGVVAGGEEGLEAGSGRVGIVEIQRRNIAGDGNVLVIRIDMGDSPGVWSEGTRVELSAAG